MAHTLLTGPLGPADRSRIEAGIERAYGEAGLPWSGSVVWAPSPFAGQRIAHERARAVEARRADAAARALPWYRRPLARMLLSSEKADWTHRKLGGEKLVRAAEQLRATVGEPAEEVWTAIHAELWQPVNPAPLHAVDVPVCWWPHPEFAVVSEPPVTVHAQPAPGGGWRLHHGGEPAIRWSDDNGLVFWRGTFIPFRPPERSFFDPMPEKIRHATIERMGWDAYTKLMGMHPVAREADPARPSGDLILHIRGWGAINELTSLATTDGAGRVHLADLTDDLQDPVAAAAEEYDVPVEVYRRSRRGADETLVDSATGEVHRRHGNVLGSTYVFDA